MEKWVRSSNYMGEDYSDCFILATHNRDSGILEESNFSAALKRMGGESDSVQIVRFSHWLCGWVEMICIRDSDPDMVQKGNDIENQLEDYPILDEEDFSNREWDAARVLFDEIKQDIQNSDPSVISRIWGPNVGSMDDEQLTDFCLESIES